VIDIFVKHYPLLLEGLWLTVQLVAVSAFASAVLALLVAVARTSRHRWVRWSAATYTEVFRSIPVLVLLVGFYYGLGPYLAPYGVTAFWMAVVALTLNESAYLAEAYRGILYSIPIAQWQAAVSLGLSKSQTLRYVVLPQFYPASLPQLTNASVYLIKSSALASLISLQELVAMGYRVVFQTFEALQVFTIVLIMYLAFASLIAYTARVAENTLAQRSSRRSSRSNVVAEDGVLSTTKEK
jgi:His/Glu/Gln/Arg/opine family amino acid ABC transporter permease subunit